MIVTNLASVRCFTERDGPIKAGSGLWLCVRTSTLTITICGKYAKDDADNLEYSFKIFRNFNLNTLMTTPI